MAKIHLAVHVEPVIYDMIAELAKDNSMNVSKYMRKVVLDHLKEKDKITPNILDQLAQAS